MKLYNTLSRQIEEIQPQHTPEVTIYTCGPTVYDYPHVGNWFTYVREDILIRTLKLSGLQPKWIMNITDVGHLTSDADDGEDKLEKGARREGKSAWEVANFYTEYFIHGLERLHILTPDELPKATDHIPEQIVLIQKLEEKGYTYIISDGVYFDTSKFPRYADFARLDLDEQQAGARVEYNRQKRNPTDFALWKFSPVDRQRDMEWDSPWTPPGASVRTSKGFPGWHIECSAMSMKYLGDTLDIHAGGIDHVPVHHTNEIAQSEAATGKPFARHWMHSNHITIEGDKISKSLGNGITLEDIEAKGISLGALRLHVLESHYRSQSKFSWESLAAAENRLGGYRMAAAWLHQPIAREVNEHADFATSTKQITEALQDDLKTPLAFVALGTTLTWLETKGLHPSQVEDLRAYLDFVNKALGIDLFVQAITEPQKQLVAQRQQARNAQDWQKSDELREELQAAGIGVRDTVDGAIWFWL